jgi:DNA invertase Pin-like site-specific DNA recombinase
VGNWGIYLRLSRDDLRGGTVSEANSIEGQRRDSRAYIDRADPDANLIEFAEEEFISASKGLDRPAYKDMLQAMADGRLDHIVAARQDRYTRDRDVEFGELKRYAREAGIQVHAADSGPLFDSEDRELSSGIRAEFAAFESKLIGRRTRSGLQTRRERGEWTSSGRTFGYSRGGVVNPEQAEQIRWAYDQILNHGKSGRDVFEHWRATGVLTANGREWTSVSRVLDMLRSPAIAGLVTYRGDVLDVAAKWEAIVTPKEQERLKAAISANARATRGYGQRRPRKHWLAGLVLCGRPECDLLPMVSQNPGNGRGYFYWHCDRRRGGCGNRARNTDLDLSVRMAALHLLMVTEAPEVPLVDFDDGPMREIEQQILDVREALARRDMRAMDAVPVLTRLRAELVEQEAARQAFEQDRQVAESWHEVQFVGLSDDDPQAIRTLIDNVRVLPGRAGYVFEGRNGVTHTVKRSGDESLLGYSDDGAQLRWDPVRGAADSEDDQVDAPEAPRP